MTDWDEVRKRKHMAAVREKVERKIRGLQYDAVCVKCGKYYMFDAPPGSIPNAMSAEGFLCRSCRNTATKNTARPPAFAMKAAGYQMEF